jgi:hypothetical protein
MCRGGRSPQAAVHQERSPADTGWPRPKRPWKDGVGDGYHRDSRDKLPDLLPAPWINGTEIEAQEDWHSFRPDAMRAHEERLCVVCGEPLNQSVILGVMDIRRRETSGPGGHPRCIWVAVNSCPHLVELESDTVAWEYVDEGVGYDGPSHEDAYGSGERVDDSAHPLTRSQLKSLARTDPLGMDSNPITAASS